MNFERTEENGSIILAIDGMIDANTASETDMMIQSCIKQTDDLTLDLKGVEYISSAGLRVILNAENAMEEKGSLTLINVNDELKEIFDYTGFLSILTIK